MLVLKRIAVSYRLPVPDDRREVAQRVHAVHARACPVARSIGDAVEIQTSLELT